MSSSTFFQAQTTVLHKLLGAIQPLAKTKRQRVKLGRPDFAVLLPVVAAVLLLISFGIVAVPMAVHDLPLLLT